MPRVSVVIPCFNHGRFIDQAVASILRQTFQDFEIVIVDDGSTDPATVRKLRGYQAPKTTVLLSENRGPSAARNTGIRAATGEYLLTLDADDWYEGTFLEKAVSLLDREPTTGLVTCGRRYFGATSRLVMPQGGDERCCLEAAVGNILFRRVCWEQAGGYCEDLRLEYEDWDFCLNVTKRGWRVAVVPEFLFHYRIHETSRRTRAHERRPENVRAVVRRHRAVFERHVEEVLVAKERKIQRLRQQRNDLLNSWSHRLGSSLVRAPQTLVAWFRRRRGQGAR